MPHLNYYLDLCVDTVVINDNAVLLRFHDKHHFWGLPGGHLDPGEDSNEAALREVMEEVGLVVELIGPKYWHRKKYKHSYDLVPPHYVNRHPITDSHDHQSFVFIATSDSREINQMSEHEVTECKWVTQEELDIMFKNGDLREDIYRYCSEGLSLVHETSR